MAKVMPKLTLKGYEITKKLFDIYYPIHKKNEQEETETRSRVVGGTDYSKFDKLAVEIEREDILSKKKILNMVNPNDIKIQRQMFEGSSKPKIEMCMIFKNEGDENLRNKNYEMARNSYEKALSNLFYNFNDDKEEQKKVEQLKCSINLNLSMVLMKLNNYKDAIGYLTEAKRLQPDNLKTFYRMAFCYFSISDYDKAREIVKDVLKKNENSPEFKQLLEDINKKELSDFKKKGKMLKAV
jgi:tetratricopeptide (TPR) repeat protein